MHPEQQERTIKDRVTWLANQIFDAFPGDLTGLKFYILDCGCLYFQKVFEDGTLDPVTNIYRETADELCEICMMQAVNWRELVNDCVVVYKSKFEIIMGNDL